MPHPRHSEDTPPPSTAGVRVDIWLWAARFFKTRSLAKQAIETGRIEIAGQPVKASRQVHVGDTMRIVRAEEVFEITVAQLSDTRAPASMAQGLYVESEDAKARRQALRAERAAARAGYQPPETKPDKRARRLIRALGDIDAL